jgi:transcriptional regulator with XRE-family HTH domain
MRYKMLNVMGFIKEERTRQGLSQEELASRAQVTSMSLYNWENYRFSPKFDDVYNLLNALGFQLVIEKGYMPETDCPWK